MIFFKIKTLAILLALAGSAAAQFHTPPNARTEAMGGAPLSDMRGVFNYPSLMMDYPNRAQATFNTGGVIATKSAGDRFAIGFAANQGRVLDTMFYARAFGAINANVNDLLEEYGLAGGNVYNDPYDDYRFNIPHLLIGFDLGALKLGANIFCEYSRYSTGFEDDDLEASGRTLIMNPGARLSVGFDGENMGLLVKFGMAFPFYNGKGTLKGEYMGFDVNNTETFVSSKKGLWACAKIT